MQQLAALQSRGAQGAASCSGRQVVPSFATIPRVERKVVCSAASSTNGHHATRKFETVKDIMSNGGCADRRVHVCRPDDTIETALSLLVEHRISGLPVVDNNMVVVGVVSDFDLLALDIIGKTHDSPLFPNTDETWQAFKVVRSALAKGTGKRVRDVMTRTPLTVTPNTNINDATSLLLQKRIRRLPVVDEATGRLVGIISRSNIIRCALETRQLAAMVPEPTAA